MREEINNWWKQAEADLKSAKNCINSGEGIPAELYDKDIASRHYKTAEDVLRWVNNQIQK